MNIGVLDSGIGGFSILHSLAAEEPQHNYFYVADSKHFPYSNRSVDSLLNLIPELLQIFTDRGCTTIVVACNTFTVTCIETMRQNYPELTFVGTVPAVKVADTQLPAGSHVVVLATENTAKSPYLQNLTTELKNVEFNFVGSTELVTAVENQDLAGIEQILKAVLLPLHLQKPIDGIVIGCTHFTFAESTMRELIPGVAIFDSRAGVVKQLKRLVGDQTDVNQQGSITFLNTLPGNEQQLEKLFFSLRELL